MNSVATILSVTLVIGATAFAGSGLSSADTGKPSLMSSGNGGLSRAEVRRRTLALTALGRALFFEKALSASGAMACASCHVPERGFGSGNNLSVQFGGPDLRTPGLRAVPSLTYIQAAPQFSEHFHDSEDDADESIDNGPTGGLTWDGRVDRGKEQARIPLLSSFEMANKSPEDVASKVLKAGYGARLQEIYGNGVVNDPKAVFEAVLESFANYEQDYKTFYPYNSRYDAYLAGKAALSDAQARGLKLFEDENKGNCAECHISRRGNNGAPPQFTDYGMIAIGVPRNPAIAANQDPAYFDLGLCGPLRTDFSGRSDYCGLFRTPSLRNVALRQTFFHNGIYRSLREAVAFYARRDTNPEEFYPRKADGGIDKFDDLPPQYRANLNTDPPFNRHIGDKPALSEAEIDDIVAFLQTLNDGNDIP